MDNPMASKGVSVPNIEFVTGAVGAATPGTTKITMTDVAQAANAEITAAVDWIRFESTSALDNKLLEVAEVARKTFDLAFQHKPCASIPLIAGELEKLTAAAKESYETGKMANAAEKVLAILTIVHIYGDDLLTGTNHQSIVEAAPILWSVFMEAHRTNTINIEQQQLVDTQFEDIDFALNPHYFR